MIRRLLTWLTIVAALTVVSTMLTFFIGMRTKHPAVQDRVRRMNRAFWNPRAMNTAGRPGAYASIIRHTGRRSGRLYATPVGAQPIDDGFLVMLPYGPDTDWVRNVLAMGSTTLLHEGAEWDADRIEVVDRADVDELLSPGDRRTALLFGIDQVLRLRATPTPAA